MIPTKILRGLDGEQKSNVVGKPRNRERERERKRKRVGQTRRRAVLFVENICAIFRTGSKPENDCWRDNGRKKNRISESAE